ncbi:energy transducer TonB [Pseudomonas kuykendallii]|uniref:Outer membrane transport energization protein TonB n=1 Tax=Pseudomonas kuykendallii TaxID=1007099 RepID=A0A1H2RFG2_9PSED|nr:energy transducer TonB [Pseudomonas kuykendallii]MCQ4272766.1 energy transducer TonB [Pseudomonas kuykendallii]SDW17564.1 outer membrane transport energization protein TonB [Pseudomonas kuykendallii]
MSIFFKSRKALASLPAICLLALAVQSALKSDLKITPKYDDSTVEVALIDPAELLPPPEPIPEPSPPPEPEPIPEPPPEPDPEPVVELPEPPPKPKPKPPEPKPQPPKPKPQVVAKPAPTPPPPQPQVTKAAEPKPAPAPVAAPAPAPPAAPTANTASLESNYIAGLHSELEKYKQYPRGREASLQRPVGNVVVWLLIDRAGKVLDAGIEKKASNMLLNKAAQTSLRRIEQVRPFPRDVFEGKDRYRFSATLVYSIEN